MPGPKFEPWRVYNKQMDKHICATCGKKFETGQQLGGHVTVHSKSFNEVKKDCTRRIRLIDEKGHQCEICKLSLWLTKPIPLELDHIDGNSDNNEKENLRLICPNCHAQTPTYRGRNRGKRQGTKRHEIMSKYPNYRE